MMKNETFESKIIDGDILAIILRGDLDSVSAPEFDRQIQGHLDAGHSKVIIDCHKMGYLSSLGIASLVALQTKLRRRGGEVKLAAIFGQAMEVMRLVRLDKMFDIYGGSRVCKEIPLSKGPGNQTISNWSLRHRNSARCRISPNVGESGGSPLGVTLATPRPEQPAGPQTNRGWRGLGEPSHR
jgi:anti-anti-sigma factor